MSPSRHRAARPALRERLGQLKVPAAVATGITGVAVAVGVSGSALPDASPVAADGDLSVAELELGDGSAFADLSARRLPASRSEARQVTLEPTAIATRYADADLNLWSGPSEKSRLLDELEVGTKLRITGQTVAGFTEILIDGKARYVNADYVVTEKPDNVPAVAGLNTNPCPRGGSIESGLTPNSIAMFRAICNAFPAVTVFGGRDPHGEHVDGRAVDFMTYENRALGQAIADYARANAAALNIRTIIFAQRIWTPERASEGWRFMGDRGSVTANHFDHPHISVY